MTQLFGTNGIRGVVNKEMTPELAVGIGKAWGTMLRQRIDRPQIALGTDARLSKDLIKTAVASGFMATGCDIIDFGVLPTPALQYNVHSKPFHSGVIITASHNPPEFNGIKGVDELGIEFSKQTEEIIEGHYFNKTSETVPWNQSGTYSIDADGITHYLKAIISLVQVDLIKKQNFHVVLDPGNGAGAVATPQLLEKLGCTLTVLNGTPDGHFPGRLSEPVPENIKELVKTMGETKAVFGVAQDGDADRAIFVDERGRYVWGDQSLTLLGEQVVSQQKGGVCVTPVTTSTMFEQVIANAGGTLVSCRVGSPVVARTMKEHNAVFGGEENGGLIFPELQLCRDSCMTIAKMLEFLAVQQNPLSALVDVLPQFFVHKTKFHCPHSKKQPIMNRVVETMKDQKDILRIDTTDGVKLYVQDGWILIRPSGTEPLFRVYAETKDEHRSKELALQYKKLVEDLIESP